MNVANRLPRLHYGRVGRFGAVREVEYGKEEFPFHLRRVVRTGAAAHEHIGRARDAGRLRRIEEEVSDRPGVRSYPDYTSLFVDRRNRIWIADDVIAALDNFAARAGRRAPGTP